MKRHNEQDKMNLRLRSQQQKRHKKNMQLQKQRANMEKSKLPLLWFRGGKSLKSFFVLKKTDKIKTFQVILREPLEMNEIFEKIKKGFGEN